MLKIYLARHGQDEDNAARLLNGHRDKPLTEKGIEQAKEVAEKILDAGITFDDVFSSPLQRAYKTAEIISTTLGLDKPKVLEDLIERDFGVLTGTPISKIKDVCGDNVFETPSTTYFLSAEGVETFPQLLKRGKRVLNEIMSKYEEGNILLVTHGDIGKMIYAAYYSLDWKQVLNLFHFGNSELILLSPDSKAEDAHVFKIGQFNA